LKGEIHDGSRFSRGNGAVVLGSDSLHAPLRQGLREDAMGWEDILGLAVSIALLWYLLWAMVRAEKV
jgi:hypothetical protein